MNTRNALPLSIAACVAAAALLSSCGGGGDGPSAGMPGGGDTSPAPVELPLDRLSQSADTLLVSDVVVQTDLAASASRATAAEQLAPWTCSERVKPWRFRISSRVQTARSGRWRRKPIAACPLRGGRTSTRTMTWGISKAMPAGSNTTYSSPGTPRCKRRVSGKCRPFQHVPWGRHRLQSHLRRRRRHLVGRHGGDRMGAAASRVIEVRGDADLTIADFADPRIGVAFTNIKNLATGARATT